MFKKILGSVVSLIKRSGSISVRGLSSYKEIDIEKAMLKLRLKEEAQERGLKNHPPTSSKNYDDIELKIIALIKNRLQKARELFKREQASYENRINSLKLSGQIQRLGGVAGTAEANFESAVREISIDKHEAKRAVDELESHMDDFKSENNLRRPAMYPDKNALLLRKALIALFIIVETIFNARFLAKGDELGLLGGSVIAIVPSLFNAAMAFALGNYFIRWISHVKLRWKLVGLLLCIVVVLLIISMNLWLSHYRSALELNVVNASQAGLHTFLTTPLTLVGIQSWYLFIVGCLFSLGTAYDSYGMDDSYPGYGKLDRKRKAGIIHYNFGIQNLLAELMAIRDEKIQALEVIHDNTFNVKFEAKAIWEGMSLSVATFNDHVEHLETAGKFLVTCYREKNIETRTDAAPERFNDEWEIDDKNKLVNDTGASLESIHSTAQDPEKIDDAFKEFSARIESAYRKSVKVIETIDEIKE